MRRALVLLGLSVCFAAWTPAVQAALRCDLAYEVVPAASPTAADFPKDAASQLASAERIAHTQAETVELAAILRVHGERYETRVSSPKVTWGGWRGASNPAIHLEVRAQDTERGWSAAQALAALLGLIYRQEAVLLACDGEGTGAASTHRVTPSVADFFAEEEALFAFFGALIGLHGNPDIGYTRLGDDFWIVDFDGTLGPALQRTAMVFRELTGGTLNFELREQVMQVKLLQNDWQELPHGGDYLKHLPDLREGDLRELQAEADGRRLLLLRRGQASATGSGTSSDEPTATSPPSTTSQ